MNKVELYWLSSFIHAAPYKGDMRLGSPLPDSPNHVRGLNDLFLGALTRNVRLVCGCQGSLTFSVAEEHSELPFNEFYAAWAGHFM